MPTIEITARDQFPLGMPAARFLRHYWQKHPVLIRNAFPGFQSPLTPEELAGLACEDGSLGRIVRHRRADDRWTLEHGPFPEQMFPDMPHRDWTLLVQDVDKWDPQVRALLTHFDFLPRWRIDDVMVSFAAPGGSVGAHVDHYDVFLLQGQGRRRWRIDNRSDPPLAFRPDAELKLLQRFTPDHEWTLDPGDMLYLPPGVPHHGIAEDACLTYSIGMRAPAADELLGDLVDTLIAGSDQRQRYRDPDLSAPGDIHEIDAAAMRRVVEALGMLRAHGDDPQWLGDWFGRFITLYRSTAETAPPEQPLGSEALARELRAGVRLLRHPWTRTAWRRSGTAARLYVGGLDFTMPVGDARRLAAAEEIGHADHAKLSSRGRDAVLALHAAGHYRLEPPRQSDGNDESGP